MKYRSKNAQCLEGFTLEWGLLGERPHLAGGLLNSRLEKYISSVVFMTVRCKNTIQTERGVRTLWKLLCAFQSHLFTFSLPSISLVFFSITSFTKQNETASRRSADIPPLVARLKSEMCRSSWKHLENRRHHVWLGAEHEGAFRSSYAN